jgi:hypothetical protein
VVYRLTEKDIDLAPILVELVLWSAQHEETGAPPAAIRKMRAKREEFLAGIRKNWGRRGNRGVHPWAKEGVVHVRRTGMRGAGRPSIFAITSGSISYALPNNEGLAPLGVALVMEVGLAR